MEKLDAVNSIAVWSGGLAINPAKGIYAGLHLFCGNLCSSCAKIFALTGFYYLNYIKIKM